MAANGGGGLFRLADALCDVHSNVCSHGYCCCVHVPEGVAAGAAAAVGVSAVNFLLASMTGFSNWVFWLMWLHEGYKEERRHLMV